MRSAGDMDLAEAVTLLPTPRAQNAETRNQNIWARPLSEPQNIENALALLLVPTGESTVPLSPAGSPSSAGQLPRQLTLDLPDDPCASHPDS